MGEVVQFPAPDVRTLALRRAKAEAHAYWMEVSTSGSYTREIIGMAWTTYCVASDALEYHLAPWKLAMAHTRHDRPHGPAGAA